ncbi:MAG: hypothetical protein AAGC97_16355 [Planctomycetota bacterium]
MPHFVSRLPFAVAVPAVLLLSLMGDRANAQSGSRNVTPSYPSSPGYSRAPSYSGSQTRSAVPSTPTGGSQTRSVSPSATKPAPVALRGYCPVCVVEMKKWIAGKPEHSVVFDGKTYLFPGEEQKKMFVSNPAKYTPALGGDCTVCLSNMSRRMEGSVQFPALYEGRLYLFPSDEQKKEFQSNPAKYAKVDLAMGGQCAVCQVEMNQVVAGKPEIATIYKGMRYLFPGEEQRKMFLASPEKYAIR